MLHRNNWRNKIKTALIATHPNDEKLFASLHLLRHGLKHIEEHIDESKFKTLESLESNDFAVALAAAVEAGGGAAVTAMRDEVIHRTTTNSGNESLTQMSTSEQAKFFSAIAGLLQTPGALEAWMGIAVDLQQSHAVHNFTPEEVTRVFLARAGGMEAGNSSKRMKLLP